MQPIHWQGNNWRQEKSHSNYMMALGLVTNKLVLFNRQVPAGGGAKLKISNPNHSLQKQLSFSSRPEFCFHLHTPIRRVKCSGIERRMRFRITFFGLPPSSSSYNSEAPRNFYFSCDQAPQNYATCPSTFRVPSRSQILCVACLIDRSNPCQRPRGRPVPKT